MNTPRKLAGIELEDDRGERHALASLWRDKPVVLVFIRHFG
jgi:cytochrome oxidase Cu insertion factor (SCO1/SenC/PrrC family)